MDNIKMIPRMGLGHILGLMGKNILDGGPMGNKTDMANFSLKMEATNMEFGKMANYMNISMKRVLGMCI